MVRTLVTGALAATMTLVALGSTLEHASASSLGVEGGILQHWTIAIDLPEDDPEPPTTTDLPSSSTSDIPASLGDRGVADTETPSAGGEPAENDVPALVDLPPGGTVPTDPPETDEQPPGPADPSAPDDGSVVDDAPASPAAPQPLEP